MASLQEWDQFFEASGIALEQRPVLLEYITNLTNSGFPIIFEFEHLAKLLGFDTTTLAILSINTTKSYRTFGIPKKRGGTRNISSPYPALASCQKWILDNILSNIKLGSHSYAYRTGRNIYANAQIHLGSNYLIKLDLTDFFGSISINRVISVFKNIGYPNSLSFHLASICCYKNSLPQGACTSPTLSNIIAKRLDRRIYALVEKLGLKYTRYADDLTISGSYIPKGIISSIRKIIESEGFKINEDKTVVKGIGQKKIVTGLCITGNGVRVPKEYRRKFRQESFYF